MNLGYGQHGPANGIGCFYGMFNKGVDLRFVDNMDNLDAIVLWGGEDISPSLYNEKPFMRSGPMVPSMRDTFEWECMNAAVKANIPIIGICRGAQILCAFAGGKLIQDVDNHGYGSHEVTVVGGGTFVTTTCHHQMMYPYDVSHELLAWSTNHRATEYNPPTTEHAVSMRMHLDKEAEVVYFPEINGFAIQCHPEWHTHGSELLFNRWMIEQIKNKCFTIVKQEC